MRLPGFWLLVCPSVLELRFCIAPERGHNNTSEDLISQLESSTPNVLFGPYFSHKLQAQFGTEQTAD